MAAESTPAISVVIPTLGARATLDLCLARLAAQTVPAGQFEVLLVADAEASAPSEIEHRFNAALGCRGRVLTATRAGASAARNAGWRAAIAPVVLFLDDDVLADPALVAGHLAVHAREERDDVGVLGSLRWASSLRVTPFMRWLDDGIQFDYGALKHGDTTGWWHFYTCNVSVKRELLRAADGFDEDAFPFGFEDLDVARRMDAAAGVGGLRLIYDRAASAEHDHPMTLEQWRSRVRRIARSERRFVARYPGSQATFFDRFHAAAERPRLRGRGAWLAQHVPRATPAIGDRIHQHAALWYAQQLAEPFLDAWNEVADGSHDPRS